jgi:hypothetical protein
MLTINNLEVKKHKNPSCKLTPQYVRPTSENNSIGY